MRNILRVFRDDVQLGVRNIIGVIVLVGLVLVPAMYAWFNDLASWDPYGNTQGLKVAVANSDEGYRGDPVPIRVKAGEAVVSSLRANKSFDWKFVDEDDAIEGVKSGEYYAAIVIPSSFSRDMMSVFSDDVTHSDIIYYMNEKANPIAPRLTDAGASQIQEEIRKQFTSTVTEIALNTMSDLSQYVDSDNFKNYAARLDSSLANAISDVGNVSGQVRSISSLVSSTNSLVASSEKMLSDSGSASDAVSKATGSARQDLDESSKSLDGLTQAVNEAIDKSAQSFDSISQHADAAYDAIGDIADLSSKDLRQISGDVSDSAQAYDQMADTLQTINADGRLDGVISQMRSSAETQRQLSASLVEYADAIDQASGESDAKRDETRQLIEQARSEITTLQSQYEPDVKGAIEELSASLDQASGYSTDLAGKIDATVASLTTATDSLGNSLGAAQGTLNETASQLDGAVSDLKQAKDDLDKALASGDIEALKKIIGDDASSLSMYLSAPVKIERNAVYPIENNGSMMIPFYTLLSLWVGAVILVAMLQVNLGQERREMYSGIKPSEEYFGRYGIFSLLSFGQSLFVCLGDVFLLQVQCVHPVLFVISGLVIGQVFAFFVYTLTVSFGNVGKALSVILLVVQVAGSGGIFPIEMSGGIYEVLYPFLPFVYGMKALQACVAGIYGMELVQSLAYIVVSLGTFSLLLGLVIRKPIIKFNNFSHEQLSKTKLM